MPAEVEGQNVSSFRRNVGRFFKLGVVGLIGYLGFWGGCWYQHGLEQEQAASKDTSNTEDIEILSWRPRILLIRNFITLPEAIHVSGLAKDAWGNNPYPTEAPKDEAAGAEFKERIEKTMWLHSFEKRDPKVGSIVDRMHKIARIPRKNGEPTMIRRYEQGEQLKWHHDSGKGIEEQRIASVMVFLLPPDEGGATLFPFADGGGGPANPEVFDKTQGPVAGTEFLKHCQSSGSGGMLRVEPRVGDAILFYPHNAGNVKDMAAWYGSCPILKGRMMVAHRFMKAKAFSKYVERHFNATYEEFDKGVDHITAERIKEKKKMKKVASLSDEDKMKLLKKMQESMPKDAMDQGKIPKMPDQAEVMAALSSALDESEGKAGDEGKTADL